MVLEIYGGLGQGNHLGNWPIAGWGGNHDTRLSRGTLWFLGEKSKPGLQHQEVGLLAIGRERTILGEPTHIRSKFSSAKESETAWMDCKPTKHTTLYWHSLRRLGVAQVWCSSVSVTTLQLVGGWRSQQVAHHCAKLLHTWQCWKSMSVPTWEIICQIFKIVEKNCSSQAWWAVGPWQ